MHSNYEKMKISMRKFFLQYDQEKMIHKFSLRNDSSYLYLTFIGHEYRIDRITGKIQWSDDHFQTMHEPDYNEVMTIYDVLCYSTDSCRLAREFVNINSISSIKTGNIADNGSFFQHTANSFNGLVDKNILDYMHYETLMFALTHLFHRLEEEMQDEKG